MLKIKFLKKRNCTLNICVAINTMTVFRYQTKQRITKEKLLGNQGGIYIV